jgi:hypothetical protein
LDFLAALLRLERTSCRQALYALFRQRLIKIKVYPGGRFEISLISRSCSPGHDGRVER